VENYQKAETIVNSEGVKQKLSALKYPLFFYDYETITIPIPLFNGATSR